MSMKEIAINFMVFIVAIACIFAAATLCLSADISESHQISSTARDTFFMTVHYTNWGKIMLAMLLGSIGLLGLYHLLIKRSAA